MTPTHEFHVYDPSLHKDSIRRLYHEVGWMREDKGDFLDSLLVGGRGWIVEIDGQAESIAHTTPGLIRYQDEDLPVSCVTSVATSRIARKKGIATRLTAHSVAQDASEGAFLSIIGVFEQGFYNQIGFGTGGYEHLISFDPAKLQVKKTKRFPKRLNGDDWKEIHQCRLQRLRMHGSLNILPAEITHSSLIETKMGFGLGFYDSPDGSLSHHLWIGTKDVERGPYVVLWMAYQTNEQLLELLSLLTTLGDQVLQVRMHEPPRIQMQDLFAKPLKERFLSAGSQYESGIHSLAYWQIRICDLSACLNHTYLSCEKIDFNLILQDPIERHLPSNATWKGLAGEYIVHLGSPCSVKIGSNPDLPTLRTSVGAFSRMWFGIRPASGLSVTDDLHGSHELLRQLDHAFRLPEPKPDWIF